MRHGEDGRGAPASVVGFDLPLANGHGFPDFIDCPTNTVEPSADWITVVHQGGPVRALDRHMPAFGDALSADQIERVVRYLWTFCRDRSAPRVSGGRLVFEVGVRNLTGHKFPTGYPSRRAWLHVRVLNEGGQPVFESGAPRADGAIVDNGSDADGGSFEPITSHLQARPGADLRADPRRSRWRAHHGTLDRHAVPEGQPAAASRVRQADR